MRGDGSRVLDLHRGWSGAQVDCVVREGDGRTAGICHRLCYRGTRYRFGTLRSLCHRFGCQGDAAGGTHDV
jgi:hypothetical protein